MSMLRHFSCEAISAALAPRTQTWARGEGVKIRPEDAAMALAGVEPLPRAFLLVSWGHDAPSDVNACKRFLRGAAMWEAEADEWPAGRLDKLIDLALEEIQHAKPADEIRRAREVGMSESMWHRLWKGRYQRILRDALDQISRAHLEMARRVGG